MLNGEAPGQVDGVYQNFTGEKFARQYNQSWKQLNREQTNIDYATAKLTALALERIINPGSPPRPLALKELREMVDSGNEEKEYLLGVIEGNLAAVQEYKLDHGRSDAFYEEVYAEWETFQLDQTDQQKEQPRPAFTILSGEPDPAGVYIRNPYLPDQIGAAYARLDQSGPKRPEPPFAA